MTINHQWSKSGEFEQLFQDYARNYITPDVTYFSLLRHSSELRIAKLFANYPKYFSLFSSCNRVGKISGQELGVKNAYVPVSDSQLKAKSCKLQTLPSPSALWCGTCAKCCFVFLMLSASLKKKDLLAIFGRNLLEDESLVPMFKNLLGFGEMKPFDCVGTFEEARSALSIARKSLSIHPSLINYSLPPTTYNLSLSTHPAPTLPARFAFLGMKKVAILGYGREGKVTKKYLKQKYPYLKIKVLDERKNKNYLLKQVNFDALVKTPGIQKDLVKIYYTTATNLFFAQVPHEQIIGVTGSKGKSTTASLIYAILKAGGKDVELLGNIGGPMLGALLTKNQPKNPFNNSCLPVGRSQRLLNDKKLFVLELSSYQLDDIQASPHVAVVSNLFPEHMNYHGSLANYYKAKENITHFQTTSDFFIASQKIELAQKWHTQAKRIPIITKLPIIETDIPLLGEHNKDNVRSALTAINLFDIPENVQAQAIRAFKGLPHRLEYIGEFRGVQFYDDAISTSPESTIEALNSLQNIGVLFLGGQDRGYNFTELEIAIKNKGIKNIVLFPESGEKIFTDTTGLNILHTKKMKDAIAFAFANAKPGEVCLLSTASPSYSVWKNFIEKGNEFQKYAKKFGK
jgi:UDP-N-acetylmuramoylalanine--D-glutamate ligase